MDRGDLSERESHFFRVSLKVSCKPRKKPFLVGAASRASGTHGAEHSGQKLRNSPFSFFKRRTHWLHHQLSHLVQRWVAATSRCVKQAGAPSSRKAAVTCSTTGKSGMEIFTWATSTTQSTPPKVTRSSPRTKPFAICFWLMKVPLVLPRSLTETPISATCNSPWKLEIRARRERMI